jgi:hypothetical protein
VELYLHSPNTPSWSGARLKHRDNFTFTLPLASIAEDTCIGMLILVFYDLSLVVICLPV